MKHWRIVPYVMESDVAGAIQVKFNIMLQSAIQVMFQIMLQSAIKVMADIIRCYRLLTGNG